MKIIDQKGKLFGLINIIDLCVLLVIVLLVGVGGYKFLGKKVIKSNSHSEQLLVTTKVFQLRTDTLKDAMKKGDRLISLTSPADAYIESVTSAPAEDKASNADGQDVKTTDPLRVDVTIKFKMSVSSDYTSLKLGSQDVAVAKGFEVKTRNADVSGVITNIEVVK